MLPSHSRFHLIYRVSTTLVLVWRRIRNGVAFSPDTPFVRIDRFRFPRTVITSQRSCFLFGGVLPSVLTAFGPRRRFYDRPVVVGSGGSYLPAKLLSLGRYSPTCVNRFHLSPMVKKTCPLLWVLGLSPHSFLMQQIYSLYLVETHAGYLSNPDYILHRQGPQGVCTGFLLVVFLLVGAPRRVYRALAGRFFVGGSPRVHVQHA